MANNPLDELVQSSLGPVDAHQAPADAAGIKPSPLPSSNQTNPPSPQTNPAVAPSSPPSDNPLDHLIAEPTPTNANASSSSDAAPTSPALSGLENTTSHGLGMLPAQPASQPTPSSPKASDSSSNPLDSLMGQQSAETPTTPNSTSIPAMDEPIKTGVLGNDLEESPMPINTLSELGGVGVSQNPIPSPKTSESLPMPGVAEHDISVAPQVVSASTPAPIPLKPIIPSPPLAPQPIPAASISPDQALTLSKKELEEKAKKLLKESPPKAKSNKKPLILGLLTLLLIFGASGGGLFFYQKFGAGSTDSRSKAGFVGKVACVSPKGIEVPAGQSSPGQAGSLGYKPASSNPNDPAAHYDVSRGEVVTFKVNVKNTTNQTITDSFRFVAPKVIESPKGTPVDENTPLDEITLGNNHFNPGDVQVHGYASAYSSFSLAPQETKALEATWTPTNDQCGLYQVDMGVADFKNTTCGSDRPGDEVVGAGFIRVVGCEALCGKECSSNATCESINSSYACNRTNQTSEWVDSTAGINSAGTGALTCFNSFDNVVSGQTYEEQHVVRNGKVWARNNKTGNWSAWTDATSLISIAGTETITGFSSFITKEGYTQQHVVKGGKVWARNNQGGSWQTTWQDVTANVSTTGSGTITGLNSFLKDDLYQVQFLVRGNEVYRRDSRTGWSEWEKVTQLLNQSGTGNITCYSGHDKQAGEMQRLVRGEKLWNYEGDWFAGECRLASNPSSQTCTPAPTPEALACTSLAKSPATPKLGDIVSFTCAATPSPVAKYEFRYTVAGGNYLPLNPEAASPNTAKLTVSSSGAHKVECRACEDAAGTKCTTWGLAK